MLVLYYALADTFNISVLPLERQLLDEKLAKEEGKKQTMENMFCELSFLSGICY